MDKNLFIENFTQAFGHCAELPIVFWYSDVPIGLTTKVNSCFFKGLKEVRLGEVRSFGVDTIGCGGGKFYTGFSEMPQMVPDFVSLKEKYKKSPEMVVDFLDHLKVPKAAKQYLHFSRIDQIDNFDAIEGVLFLATPDVLSGLVTWAYFDNNEESAVVSLFGSGCSAIVTQSVLENQKGGRRTFLGLFDPSARIHFEQNLLSYVIPMSRFSQMYHTMKESCLFDTHAWTKVKDRINE